MKLSLSWVIAVGALLLVPASGCAKDTGSPAGPLTVEVRKTAEGYQLLRDGSPYFVRGVGGDYDFTTLPKIGGNSFRTWGAEQLDETRIGDDGVERPLLDHAHRLGLSVAAGYWMEHPRAGFDYTDAGAVRAQLDRLRAFVERHKDHPAILLWGLGNEVEIDVDDREVVFSALNDAAKLVKSIDPHHPTMIVLAGIGDDKGADAARWCPDVDIIGVNSYGGLKVLAQGVEAQGVDKPFIVAEYGPVGHWEMPTTPWGAEKEQTSTEKAEFILENYESTVAGSALSLGGYAFKWGFKQERTATWFGMFLSDGTPLQSIETLQRLWGVEPASSAPRLMDSIEVDFDPLGVGPGQEVRASIDAQDPDGDPLSFEWVIRAETTDRRAGGDREEAPPEIERFTTDAGSATFRTPSSPGAYRVFVYVRDGTWAATANVPFLVTESP